MTQRDRDRVLVRWARSGLSAAEFAPLAGVSQWTLYDWRRKARVAAAAGAVSHAGSSSAPRFVEVVPETDAPHDSGLVLELPRGVTLRIGRDFDAGTLRRAVEALLA